MAVIYSPKYVIGIATFCIIAATAQASDTPPPVSVALVGDLQSELGCPGDWQPECLASELYFNGVVWRSAFSLPAGNWQYKATLNDSWAENYGQGGARDGANFPLMLIAPTRVTFTYDHETHIISDDAQPASVTIAGSLQDELGCPGDWQVDCSATHLDFDTEDGVWEKIFSLPAGTFEYKAALNDSWDENYGANAQQNGSNIALNLGGAGDVKFYYDDASHWITDNVNSVIAVAPGSFQSELGCSGNWQPWCLQSWLQDPDGDGVYTFSTSDIPPGDYEVKVALNESWDLNYGEGGVQNGPNIGFSVPVGGALVVFSYDSATHVLTVGGDLPKGDLGEAKAYWLSENTIAWPVDAPDIRLHYSADASLKLTGDGVEGGQSIALTRAGVVGGAVAEKFPHLTGLPAYEIGAGDLSKVPDILRGQFVVAAKDAAGEPVDATGVQPPGVLDDLYASSEPLGVSFNGAVPTIAVWAPTAQSVALHLFDSADPSAAASVIIPMTRDDATGVWRATGDASWNRKYYLFAVDVYARSTGAVEHNLVTDPYSLNLSMNSKRSQIVNLDDPDLMPPAWENLRKPRLDAPEDAAIYELHVRDFSAGDKSVPASMRGTFKAFSLPQSKGMKHLHKLATSGLTHVHLLPAFDCASINEDKSQWQDPGDFSGYGAASDAQQAAIDSIRDQDGFNWCYDPQHYTAPEGSYATSANGTARILEFREMVAGLKKSGLRVVMDVVYNHTSGNLQGENSVLDRVVPDYYHRLNSTGALEMSSCCANTATEHAMMEKLMLDSLETWAVEYKVDGFRFDLMGHHTRDNIVKARDRLQALTMAADGVDGSSIYLYGEGWNFGEVANDARFVQATQNNMGEGTGVGTFNDRLRDAIRGGGPFDSGVDHVRRQGFANGLYVDPNAENQGNTAEFDELMRLTDWVRLGLAGSLEDFAFVDHTGATVTGGEIDYFGNPGAGYTSDPQEVINYVAAHDNETLFDIGQYKLPLDATTEDRIRAATLANAVVALSQGVPFFHAGQDMLRSKSMDRNSYNSGDWFNILDFTYATNGWGRGLPPFGDNNANWSVIAGLLANPALAVEGADIASASARMQDYLKIRRDEPLFRLRNEAAVMSALHFHNTGPAQIPGLIVMSLSDGKGPHLVVMINAAPESRDYMLDLGRDFALHPVLQESRDPTVRTSSYDSASKTFTAPGRTVAVFVAEE